jgi:hypothetical protein
LLADLPTELAIRIAGHIAATLVRPMEDLHLLWATCHFMRCMCSDREFDQLIFVERFYKLYRYVVPDGYLTLLPRLAQVGNLEACFVIRMIAILCYPLLRPLPVIDKNPEHAAHGGHKAATYVAGGGAKMLSNEECYQIREKVMWLRFCLWMRRKTVVFVDGHYFPF